MVLGTGQIPTMTSNTAPSGTASASSVSSYYPGDVAYYAMNGGTAGWLSNVSDSSPTLTYQFATGVTIGNYQVGSGTSSAVTVAGPHSWTLQGSNDGSTWTTLDTQSGQSWVGVGATKIYAIASPGSYTYYRLTCNQNRRHRNRRVQVPTILAQRCTRRT